MTTLGQDRSYANHGAETRQTGASAAIVSARNPRSIAAEAAFRERLAGLGAELLEREWLGALAKHAVRCRGGHLCQPRPASVQQGQGICKACAGQDPQAAEAWFRARVAELGGRVVGSYRDSVTRVLAICADGHECFPLPASVKQGGGICRTCVGQDPAASEAKFLSRLAGLGATPLYVRWGGAGQPHDVACAAGHACTPRPSDTIRGHGICLVCARKDTASAEAAFRARLSELGAVMLAQSWRGVDSPHLVQCPEGHTSRPRPTHVQQGHGICRICKGLVWDAFYVVTSPEAVKFGITSGAGRHRLRTHAAAGFIEVMRLVTGLAGNMAPDAETAVRRALLQAGEVPIRGREYFDISAVALVLDVADSWLATEPTRESLTIAS